MEIKNKTTILLLVGVLLIYCTPKDPETGYPIIEQDKLFIIEPYLEKCTGLIERECLIVNGKRTYEGIRGFKHQEGVWTKILVDRFERTDDVQDVGKWGYILKKRLDEIDSRDRPTLERLCGFYEGQWIETQQNCRIENIDFRESYCFHANNC